MEIKLIIKFKKTKVSTLYFTDGGSSVYQLQFYYLSEGKINFIKVHTTRLAGSIDFVITNFKTLTKDAEDSVDLGEWTIKPENIKKIKEMNETMIRFPLEALLRELGGIEFLIYLYEKLPEIKEFRIIEAIKRQGILCN